MSVNGVTGASNAYSTYATNTKGQTAKQKLPKRPHLLNPPV